MTLSVSLQHRIGAFALDVSFDAPSGITVLYGRSGSGKTTIVNALAGLVAPEAGHIAIDNWVAYDSANHINLPPHRRGIGYIFQEGRLFPHLTVAQNLKYGGWFSKSPVPRDTTDRVIELLGIASLLDRRPDRLSGGEKQRVAIGRALLSNPRLILADEPLAALDEARKAEILPYFERLRDEFKVPFVYVSHSGSEVARLADTLVVIEGGKLLRAGPAADVLSDPDVTPMGASSAGVTLKAVLANQHDDGISELSADGFSLLLPRVSMAAGTDVRVRIAAQDVMIATTRPTGISALNVLPATVTSLRLGGGPGALAQLKVGNVFLLARITRRSVEALHLRAGSEVFAVLKAVSVPRSAVGDAGLQK